MKETSKIPFPTHREQDCTREHYDGMKGKLQINENLPFNNKRFICYIVSI